MPVQWKLLSQLVTRFAGETSVDVTSLRFAVTLLFPSISTVPGLLVPLAAPPQLSLGISPSYLRISWPADYSGYVLEGQTNAPGEGVSTNWYPVSGVTGNSLEIPIDPTAGSTWYRLTRPLP